jgi:hypothetical protein
VIYVPGLKGARGDTEGAHAIMKVSRLRHMLGVVCITGLLVVTAACREEQQTSATPFTGVFTGSPTAAPGVGDAPEEVHVTVSDASFDTREIRLQEGSPTMMHVTNDDDVDYVLRIGELVLDTPLPAGEVTTVSFTTPVAGEYQAVLLDSPGGNELDSVLVNVAQPGG